MHLFVVAALVAAFNPPETTATTSLNAVIGDAGFVARYHRDPTAADGDVVRITAHLEHVIAILRRTPAPTVETQAERRRLLEHLAGYAAAGIFPHNHAGPGRRPVFIDGHGTRCAVGELIAYSVGPAAAEAVAARHRYDLVLDMHDPAVDAWAAAHGFTLVELAMIQPTYIDQDDPWGSRTRTPEPAPQEPDPRLPVGVPSDALPSAEAILALTTGAAPQTFLAVGDVLYTRVDRGIEVTIIRTDRSGRVTGIGSGTRPRRLTWTSFDGEGRTLSHGMLRDGAPFGRWKFSRPDGPR